MKYCWFLFSLFSSCVALPHTSTTLCDEIYVSHLPYQVPSFPRQVKISPSMPIEAIEATYDAVERWNEVAGREILVASIEAVKDRTRGTIVVREMTIFNPERRGSTVWTGYWAVVEIRADELTDPAVGEIITHEVGHALNLHHENDRDSVMNREVFSNSEISDLSKCLIRRSVEEGEWL